MDDLITILKRKNMKITENLHWGIYFRKRWENSFTNHLDQEEKERIYLYGDRYTSGYLWHIFSYEKLPHLRQVDANKMFDSLKKTKCYIFYQHSPEILFVERADALKANDFLHEKDIYIVDENFTWTYVVTHESYCGPYFTSQLLLKNI